MATRSKAPTPIDPIFVPSRHHRQPPRQPPRLAHHCLHCHNPILRPSHAICPLCYRQASTYLKHLSARTPVLAAAYLTRAFAVRSIPPAVPGASNYTVAFAD